MSLTTPTTQEISDNIVAQLEASLSQTVPLLPKSFVRVTAKALAGVFVLLYKYIGFMFLQQFVRTASNSPTVVNGVTVTPLLEWGRLIGVGDPAAAVQAELSVEITVENQTGTLPANTQLVGPDNGVTYITLAAVALDAATKTVTVRAVSDQTGGGGAGVIGNLTAGALLSFANPLANVSRTAEVLAQTVTGANAESTDAYRQRVLDRFQKPPQGGALTDYELWGETPAGIVNVYPYRSDCPGQVDLYVEATVASSGSLDGIPTTAQLQAVLDAVKLDDAGLASRQPVGDLVQVLPISRTAFDVTVSNLIVDDAPTVQDQIETALTAFYLAREPWIEGLSAPPRTDRVSASSASAVVDAIVSAAGGTFDSLTQTVGGIPTPAATLAIGTKAKLGALTFA